VTGTKQHYLKASLIGGFGLPAPSGPLREAKVAARWKVTGAVDKDLRRAAGLAYQPVMYRLASPPPGVDPDVVDTLWDPVEGVLPGLTGRLASRRLQPGDDVLLFA
jgi:hypothetical protein